MSLYIWFCRGAVTRRINAARAAQQAAKGLPVTAGEVKEEEAQVASNTTSSLTLGSRADVLSIPVQRPASLRINQDLGEKSAGKGSNKKSGRTGNPLLDAAPKPVMPKSSFFDPTVVVCTPLLRDCPSMPPGKGMGQLSQPGCVCNEE